MDPRINAELAEVFVEKSVKCVAILAPLIPTPEDSELIRDLKADNQESFKEIRENLPLKYSINEENLLLY